MDLADALSIVNAEAEFSGRSDDLLIDEIRATKGFEAPSKIISVAANLENGVIIRPVEALHKLSFATRPRYQDDLLDRYLQWALTRYLGFFELGPCGTRRPLLQVSASGRRIVGNQRRVASEELGIAFAALLADRWLQSPAGRPTINLVDVDVALLDRHVLAGGSKLRVRAAGPRRPDYLLLASDPSTPAKFYVRILECKGTRNRNYAIRQLARALGQLDGIEVDNCVPTGLAVTTIAADKQMTYLALDPEGDEESYEIDPDFLRQGGRFELPDASRSVPSRELLSAALRGSWATLADFGGNLEAVDLWAPEVMRRRLERQPRQRERWETPYGTAAGTSVTFSFDNQRLTVRHGIAANLDERLSGLEIESILEAQAEFTQSLTRDHSFSAYAGSSTPDEVHSASPEGSIFSLHLT
jgi:hypothetical protein